MRRKRLFITLLVLLLTYGIWLTVQALKFQTYPGALSSSTSNEIVGAFHIHTTFSDGRKSVGEVARVASSEGLDFIIITDHGSPNRESFRSQGWKEDVLVLVGTEISSNRGHLVGLGFNQTGQDFSHTAEQAVYQLLSQGGFSVIAHPYSKTSWTWGETVPYGGIEIISADGVLKRNIVSSIPYWPALLFKPSFLVCKILKRPEKNIAKWDALSEHHPIYGYYSVDAHLLYRLLLSAIKIHIPLAKPLQKDFDAARRQVYGALARGNFYNAIDAAARADGFHFWLESGAQRISMGGSATIDLSTVLRVVSPPGIKALIQIFRNGQAIHQSDDQSLSYKIMHPGSYRVEVYLREKTPLKPNVPWILSNPISLKEKTYESN
jgi:hypothetical protein